MTLDKLQPEIETSISSYVRSALGLEKVVGQFDGVIEVTSKIALRNLDYWERRIRNAFDKALREEQGSQFQVRNNTFEFATWLDLCSWDGRRREKVLRTLRERAPNPFFLAVAIRRLNDWVPQVRQAAQAVLPKLLEKSDASLVAQVICFTLNHWSSWSRIDDNARKIVLAACTRKEVLHAVKAKLMQSAQGPLCLLLTELVKDDLIDTSLFDISQSAVQPSLRAKALRMLLDKKAVWCTGRKWVYTDKRYGEGKFIPVVASRPFEHNYKTRFLLTMSANDPSSIVRRVGAEILIREIDSGIEAPQQLAELFALDSSVAVSERGEFAMKKLNEEPRHLL